MKGYVYCITNEYWGSQNIYKIGYTTDLKQRKANFDEDPINFTGEFNYIATKEYDSREEAAYAESQIHKLLSAYRIKDNKEWFKLENKDLIRVAFDLKCSLFNAILDKENEISEKKQKKIEEKIEIIKLHKEGNSIRKIAKLTGCSKSKVGRIINYEE